MFKYFTTLHEFYMYLVTSPKFSNFSDTPVKKEICFHCFLVNCTHSPNSQISYRRKMGGGGGGLCERLTAAELV